MALLTGPCHLVTPTGGGGFRAQSAVDWSPNSLSPLARYRMDLANLTLSPNVSALADISGNGRHGSQVTIGEQATTGVIVGLNNAPAIVCNNSGVILPTYTLPTPCTVFLAGEISATPGQYAWLYGADAVYGVQSGRLGTYNADFSASGMPLIGTAPVPFVALYFVDSMGAGGVRIRVNGVTYVSTAGVVGALGVYSIGYRPGTPTQSVACKVAEVCPVPGTLSGSPLASLSAYSIARYGRSF